MAGHAQDRRTGEAGYEARLQKAEEHVSAIAGAAEARSQAKMLAEVERYKARPLPSARPGCPSAAWRPGTQWQAGFSLFH